MSRGRQQKLLYFQGGKMKIYIIIYLMNLQNSIKIFSSQAKDEENKH